MPTVSVADLKAAWKLGERVETQYGVGVAIAGTAATDACSPGADIRAIGYRCGILRILTMWPEDILAPWRQDRQFHDAVFIVLATLPMTWVEKGSLNDPPFDMGALLEELRKQTP